MTSFEGIQNLARTGANLTISARDYPPVLLRQLIPMMAAKGMLTLTDAAIIPELELHALSVMGKSHITFDFTS